MGNIKTNNVQELLKAKGISTKQSKTSASKLYDSAPAGTRIYNLEVPLPLPVEEPPAQALSPTSLPEETTEKASISIGVNAGQLGSIGFNQGQLESNTKETAPSIVVNRVQPGSIGVKDDPPHKNSAKKSIRVNWGQNSDQSKKEKSSIGVNGGQLGSIGVTDTLNQLGSNGVSQLGSIGVNAGHESGSLVVNTGQTGSAIGGNWGQTQPSVMELKVLIFIQNLRHGDPLNKAQISQATGLKSEGVKTALRRLKTKGFIQLKDCSAGRYTGFTVYELTGVAKEFLASGKAIEKIVNWGQQSGSIGVSYSSSININTTTTDPEILIPPELQNMGVGMKSLTSYLTNMTAQEIQQSIDAFNYDMINGLVKSSTPLNMLFGILKKGRPYLSSHFTEQLNRDVAEAVKRAEEVQQKHKALEEANFKARFYEWRLNNKEEADKLLATSGLGSRSEKIAESFLMGEFRKLEAQEG